MVEILYMLEADERIAAIGTSLTQIWPEEKTSRLPNVGSLARPSFEKIISFEPDLVILNGMNTDVAENLKALGIPTIIHSVSTFSEIFEAVLIMGELTGTNKKAAEIVERHSQTLEVIRASLRERPLRLKGAFIYSAEPMMAFQQDSLPGQILQFFGVENIAKELATERPILSPEYFLEQNPDFILGAMSINSVEDIMDANRMVRRTRAGKEGNIYILPSQMILRPSPRILEELPDLYEKLALLTGE
jgi:iron complex transport system substrate-binding protein